MPDKFQKWFDENSGYALHHTSKRVFCHTGCCGEAPQRIGKRILFPTNGQMEKMELYRCEYCGMHYVRQGSGFCRIENLLKYPLLP